MSINIIKISALFSGILPLLFLGLTACNDNVFRNSDLSQMSPACGDHSWCDKSLNADKRASLLLAQLTPLEKYQLMSASGGKTPSIDRLDIPAIYTTDGGAGVRLGGVLVTNSGATPDVAPPAAADSAETASIDGDASTAWPAPIAVAATWDPSLALEAGTSTGKEAKAHGYDIVFGPNVNILRTPLNGRTFEAYGEDPLLTGSIGGAWAEGIQSEGVIATVKHYIANNQESNRHEVNVKAADRTLREVYLPAFESIVKHGQADAVMAAYNKVNGDHMTQNEALVRDLLKNEWHFPGAVWSDFMAQQSTVQAGLAGTDVELSGAPQFYSADALAAAVKSGDLPMSNIDGHVSHILDSMFALGQFDRDAGPKPEEARIPGAALDSNALKSEQIEDSAITLLKNDESTLPLNDQKLSRVAVIGSTAARYKAGLGSAYVKPFNPVTPLAGIRDRLAGTGASVAYDAGADHQQAAAIARNADVAIVVVGDFESEGADRPCLGLDCQPQGLLDTHLPFQVKDQVFKEFPDFPQDDLVSTVAAAQPHTIVVVESGAPVLMPWADSVPSIIEAYYPGERGGHSIASVLFGDVNPSGHLPFTIPAKAEDTATAGNDEQYPGVDGVEKYSEGVFIGYRHYDEAGIEPLFAFGHGLSYTRFAFSGLEVNLTAQGGDVSAYVSNTGDRKGAEVAQLYLQLPDTEVEEPPKWLRGFKKVTLAPGEAKRVHFDVSRRDVSYWREQEHTWAVADGCYKAMIGASSRDIRQSTQFCLDVNPQ